MKKNTTMPRQILTITADLRPSYPDAFMPELHIHEILIEQPTANVNRTIYEVAHELNQKHETAWDIVAENLLTNNYDVTYDMSTDEIEYRVYVTSEPRMCADDEYHDIINQETGEVLGTVKLNVSVLHNYKYYSVTLYDNRCIEDVAELHQLLAELNAYI